MQFKPISVFKVCKFIKAPFFSIMPIPHEFICWLAFLIFIPLFLPNAFAFIAIVLPFSFTFNLLNSAYSLPTLISIAAIFMQ